MTGQGSLFLFCVLAAIGCGAKLNAQSIPTLAVDATASQHAINPNIYGIANYALDATYAQQIQVPNIRWGGDGTTRYNWQVDSSNSGFDWYSSGEVQSTISLAAGTANIAVGIINPDAEQKSPVVKQLPVHVAPSASI